MNSGAKKVFAYTGIFAVAGGALGAGIWAITSLTSSKSTDNNVGSEITYAFKSTYQDASGAQVTKSIEGLEIGQFETKMPDGSYDYFLNQEGIDYLTKRFFETANYGPEIFNLKKIWIANVKFTDDNENGLYIPGTGEIGLNAVNDAARIDKAIKAAVSRENNYKATPSSSLSWQQWYDKLVYAIYNKDGNLSLEDAALVQKIRAEMLFETLMHEYGHHLAYSYFSSPFNTTKTVLYDKSGDKSAINVWSKDFVDNFTSQLNYQSSPVGWTKPTNTSGTTQDKKTVMSIGDRYTADELWKRANTDSVNFEPMAKSMYAFYYSGQNGVASTNEYAGKLEAGAISSLQTAGISEDLLKKYNPYMPYSRLPYDQNYIYVDGTSQLQYLYSQEELFTRKALLSSMTVDKETFPAIIQNKLRTDIVEEQNKIQSDLLYDGNEKDLQNMKMDKSATGPDILADDPFYGGKNDAAKSIVESIDAHMGHKDGDDISVIFNENRFEVSERGKMSSEPTGRYANNIKFGGYFGQDEADKDKYDCIVALDAQGNVSKEISDINILPFSLGYKTTAFGSTRTSVDGEKYFYATKSFVDKSNLVGLQLAFAKKSSTAGGKRTYTNIEPMKTFRGQTKTYARNGLAPAVSNPYGTASNYLEHLPSWLQWKVSSDTYKYMVPKALANGNISLDTVDIPAVWGGA